MSTPSPSARAYRLLGCLALAHAVVLIALSPLFLASRGTDDPGYWLLPLWIGLVTLWFFWPVVLALHRGRSAVRFAVFISIAAVLLLPSLRFYGMMAPWTFGLPDGVDLNPIVAWKYFSAYQAGRAEAQRDVAAGILAIEECGFGAGTGPAVRILRERYQIEIRAVAQCIVDEKILGHVAGYNKVSEREIDRRVGRDRVAAAREEGARLAAEERAREEQFFKDLTNRLSTLPPGGKVLTESIEPYLDQQPLNDAAAEAELAEFVQAVEKCVVEAVPEEAPPFDMDVSARLTSGTRPSFEMHSPQFPPEAVWKTISDDLQAIPSPRWTRGALSVHFDFVIRERR